MKIHTTNTKKMTAKEKGSSERGLVLYRSKSTESLWPTIVFSPIIAVFIRLIGALDLKGRGTNFELDGAEGFFYSSFVIWVVILVIIGLTYYFTKQQTVSMVEGLVLVAKDEHGETLFDLIDLEVIERFETDEKKNPYLILKNSPGGESIIKNTFWAIKMGSEVI